jgi:heavy metal efflux system protein
LLPAAISTGIGSQVQRPLATVVVGGMLIGPLILLIVVPALQTMFLGQGGGPMRQGDNGRPGGVAALSDRSTVE